MNARDEVLAALDLRALADELLGPRKGTEGSGMWACPSPQHAQTGRTPPVSVFLSRRGDQRWRCHGCGAGGTAIDLLIAVTGCDVREAFEALSRRADVQPAAMPTRAAHGGEPRSADGAAALNAYVAECADRLWRREGAAVRWWLMGERRLPEQVLRVNSIGADPGPHRQSRPPGVPRAGVAAVFPVIEQRTAVYAQLRRLRPTPDQPKYLNVASELAPNPKLTRYRPVEQHDDSILVTEGPIDALSAAAAGFRAVAVLGATSTGAHVARQLAALNGRVVLAFDADDAGQTGADRLLTMLAELDRAARLLELPAGIGDINEWHVAEGRGWPEALRLRVSSTRPQRDRPDLALRD